MMLMRCAITIETNDRARSRRCNGLLNGNTHINRIEIRLLKVIDVLEQHNEAICHLCAVLST